MLAHPRRQQPDFMSAFRAERTLESRPRGYVCEMVPYLDQLIRF
jgi:hypothetical protein